jgi:hypothetical protein
VTRSISPAPATLSLADVRRLDAVRERLCHALRVTDTLTGLRTYVAELASAIESELRAPAVVTIDADAEPAADTQRMFGAPWDGDSAPPTPRASTLGEEYGV